MNAFDRLERRFDGGYIASRLAPDHGIDAPAIDLTMVGNRSLSPKAVRSTVLVVAGLLGLGAARALVFGAWPIATFLFADGLLFGALMLAFIRRPPPRERLAIANGRLRLEQFWPGGAKLDVTTAFARLDIIEASTGEPHLQLRLRGRCVAIASMLSPDERREVAKVVRQALQAA